MRAYQMPKGGAGIEAVVQVERPDPKPGHRQVLVKVKACSLNFRDLGIVRGTYRMPVRETSFRCPTAPAKWSRSGPASAALKSAIASPAISFSAGPAASRRPMCMPARLAAASTACSRTMRCWKKTAW